MTTHAGNSRAAEVSGSLAMKGNAGELVTSFVPNANQLKMWGIETVKTLARQMMIVFWSGEEVPGFIAYGLIRPGQWRERELSVNH